MEDGHSLSSSEGIQDSSLSFLLGLNFKWD